MNSGADAADQVVGYFIRTFINNINSNLIVL